MSNEGASAEGPGRAASHGAGGLAGGAPRGPLGAPRLPPPPPSRTKWTRRVPHPVLIGHAASLTGEAHRGCVIGFFSPVIASSAGPARAVASAAPHAYSAPTDTSRPRAGRGRVHASARRGATAAPHVERRVHGHSHGTERAADHMAHPTAPHGPRERRHAPRAGASAAAAHPPASVLALSAFTGVGVLTLHGGSADAASVGNSPSLRSWRGGANARGQSGTRARRLHISRHAARARVDTPRP